MFGRNIEAREWILHLFHLHLAALGNLPSGIERLRIVPKNRFHLLPGFHVEFRMIEAHTIGVRNRFTGGDAHQNFVGTSIVFAQVVSVVGGHQRHTHFFRQAIHQRDKALVLLHAVILNFQEKIIFAVDVSILVCQFLTLLILIGQQRFVDIATKTRRHSDDAF